MSVIHRRDCFHRPANNPSAPVRTHHNSLENIRSSILALNPPPSPCCIVVYAYPVLCFPLCYLQALSDGKTRQILRLSLPLIGATEIDDWPGGDQQRYKACGPMVEKILLDLPPAQVCARV